MIATYKRSLAKPEPSDVARLAAKLEQDVLILHHQFTPGYGPLFGPQNVPGAARPAQARLRLLTEKHLMDSLRISGRRGFEVWLDYPDDDRPLDEIHPRALVIARHGLEPITAPMKWTRKALRFGPALPVTAESINVLLGCQDSGEMLVQVVTQIVAAAVIALGDDAELEVA
ncbi:hypothetical protein V8J38_14045 [Brevundimonas olei]|uniref:Uncharacterized protein n=1 Tax=Brevundimonas olei TaxID=657642 RepID=A0ABZ2IF09_9CAUL